MDAAISSPKRVRSRRFKFKSSSTRRKRSDEHDFKHKEASSVHNEANASSSKRRRRSRHISTSRSLSPAVNQWGSFDQLDPDTAFKESLFDALVDDAGAEYWEGVYGQPVHVYPTTKQGAQGELEQMTEDEYATYVRNRMWEKTHQHLIEERQKRQEQRQKDQAREQQRRAVEADRADFDARIEEALERGQKRRKERSWQDAWLAYEDKWSALVKLAYSDDSDTSEQAAAVRIPWPVLGGARSDVCSDSVAKFFSQVPHDNLASTLKAERIRWHPDKMHQRFRQSSIDQETSRLVTAVFQIVDDLWSRHGKSAST